MVRGILKMYNTERGFGFIATEDDVSVFIHRSMFPEDVNPSKGMKLEFEIEESEKGLRACNVEVIPKYTDVV